jgi:biopolymer transport protein ExbD
MSWHRRRKLPPELEPEGFSMTPMIDIVFQLLMFFMIATDMASQQVEALTLPGATRAVLSPPTEPELVLNVMPDGRIRIGGRTFSDKALEDLFATRSQRPRDQNAPVVLRADRSTPFEHLQKILMIASTHGQVTRIHLSAKQERKDP